MDVDATNLAGVRALLHRRVACPGRREGGFASRVTHHISRAANP